MNYIRIGKIINTFGIKGELKVESHTDFIKERYKSTSLVYLGEKHLPLVVKNYRIHKGFIIVLFENYEDINLVLNFKDQYLYKAEEDIDPLKDGEYYFKDLRGLDVFVDNEKVGEVICVEKGNTYNFLRIKKGKEEILVPNIKPFVLNIDILNKRIDITKMEGLLWK